jgi:hypothetical protein
MLGPVAKWKSTKPDKFVSGYAATNPAEDFAESVSGYRFNPKRLQAIAPEKYEFLKQTVFDGLEFLNEAGCSNPKYTADNVFAQLKTDINKLFSAPTKDTLLSSQASQSCGDKILNNFNQNTGLVSLDSGIKDCMVSSLVAKKLANDTSLLPKNITYKDEYLRMLAHSKSFDTNKVSIDDKKLSDTINSMMQDSLKAAFKDRCTNPIDWNTPPSNPSTNPYSYFTDPKIYCKKCPEFAYQSKKFGEYFEDQNAKFQLVVFDNRDKISSAIEHFCITTYTKVKKLPEVPNDEDIEAAAKQFFGNQ